MKLGFLVTAAAMFTASAILPASAGMDFGGVEFGAPDFPNYLSRPGAVSCDWQYENYWRACPDPQLPPKVEKVVVKTKSKSASKTK